MSLSNRHLAEIMARAADDEEAGTNRQKALLRAARSAYAWPVEAAHLLEAGRPLIELPSVGPWLASVLESRLASPEPPDPPDPPELRRGFLTVAEARETLAQHPDWAAGVRADLQMHTTYSDGRAALRDMVRACQEVHRYEFVNITDHSKGLRIARGMDEAELAEQAADIAEVNREVAAAGGGLRILHGLEMNLSPDGEGDMDPAALRPLDLVLGAFHSKLRVTEDQTGRYVAALRNPDINVLAHPRGRRFNVRLGLHADWRVVAEEAAAQGKALEIDAHPDRQDLDVETLRPVREAGGMVSIGTDAHHPSELRFMELGLAAAIRAGIPRDRILNFLPPDEVAAWAGRG